MRRPREHLLAGPAESRIPDPPRGFDAEGESYSVRERVCFSSMPLTIEALAQRIAIHRAFAEHFRSHLERLWGRPEA